MEITALTSITSFLVITLVFAARVPNCALKCAERTCLDEMQLCDGIPDCRNGEDENFCGRGSSRRLLSSGADDGLQDSAGGCVFPESPPHGRLSVAENEEAAPGDTVPAQSAMFVDCDEGYSPSDSSHATCLNGRWTATLSCAEMCPGLQAQTVEASCRYGTSGKKGCDAPQPSGTLATFRCQPGHHSSSKLPSSVCIGGKWSGQVPSCLRNTTDNYLEEMCALPPQISYGEWLISGNSPYVLNLGDRVPNIVVLEYVCYGDTSLYGDRYVFCVNGSWTSDPKCHKFCSPISSTSVRLSCKRRPEDQPGPCSSLQHSGTVVTATCELGYSSGEPLARLKCLDGVWDSPVPECHRNWATKPAATQSYRNLMKSVCEMPPKPPNGRYIAGANRDIPPGYILPYYASLFVECDPGYSAASSYGMFSYCSDNGIWKQPLTCLKMCPPLIVPHSSITCDTPDQFNERTELESVPCSGPMKNGTIASIECKDSYFSDSIIPPIICRDGGWDHPMPVCKSKNLGHYIPVLTNGSCVLPNHDPNGHFTYLDDPELTTGAVVPKSSILAFSCNSGYYLEGNNISICLQSKWNNIPKCLETCDVLSSVTVDFTCTLNGVGVNCSEPLRNGTVVRSKCKNSYRPLQLALPSITCIEGQWDKVPPRCKEECGTVTPKSEQKIINGRSTKLGEFPWHVGLYDHVRYTGDMQICGGSMVNALVIITAAHCVWDTYEGRTYPPSDYAVAAGKLHRDWDSPEDDVTFVQQTNVSIIYVPGTYGGDAQNQQSDIAILVVEKPFILSPFVRPVCINWDPRFADMHLSEGNLGEVSGWGLTDNKDKSSSSPILKTIQLPFVEYSRCRELTPETFHSLLVADKFCAGYHKNGSAVCRGDSGGGLVFRSFGDFADKYFLLGIVSVGPRDDARMDACRDDTFTAFTRVLAHEQWVTDILNNHTPR